MIKQENERIHRQQTHLETELIFFLDPPPALKSQLIEEVIIIF